MQTVSPLNTLEGALDSLSTARTWKQFLQDYDIFTHVSQPPRNSNALICKPKNQTLPLALRNGAHVEIASLGFQPHNCWWTSLKKYWKWIYKMTWNILKKNLRKTKFKWKNHWVSFRCWERKRVQQLLEDTHRPVRTRSNINKIDANNFFLLIFF